MNRLQRLSPVIAVICRHCFADACRRAHDWPSFRAESSLKLFHPPTSIQTQTAVIITLTAALINDAPFELCFLPTFSLDNASRSVQPSFMPKLPPWIKGLSSLVGVTLTVNSIDWTYHKKTGAMGSTPLLQDDFGRWLLAAGADVIGVAIRFTLTNGSPVAIPQPGHVGGHVDHLYLNPFPVPSLEKGQTVQGSISFPTPNTLGDNIVTLTYRIGLPLIPGSAAPATTTADLFVYTPIN
jgi:hypothetical protein